MSFGSHDDRPCQERLVVVVAARRPIDRVGRRAALAVDRGVAVHGPDQPASDLRVVDDELALAGHVVGVVGLHELLELDACVVRLGRHGQADAPDVVAAGRPAHRRLHLVAPERPERLPLLGDVIESEPGLLEQVAPDVDMVGREPHRQRVEGAPAGGRVEQGGEGERVRVEQAGERQDLVREVDEPVLVGPLARGIGRIRSRTAKSGGCPASTAAWTLAWMLIVRMAGRARPACRSPARRRR